MERARQAEPTITCVDIPELPLQMLLRIEPKWADCPVAVVKDDRPQGEVLWVNEHARALRVLPGMRYAAAQNLASDLRAAVVDDDLIDQTLGELFTALCGFSPRVEVDGDRPGVFFVDPSGLCRLYGGLEAWSQSMQQALRARGFSATIIAGFHRYRSYAIARTHRGAWVLSDPKLEAQMAAAVPLAMLDLPPKLRDELALLGIKTLGKFMALPGSELASRFGPIAAKLHAQVSDPRYCPLVARELVDPIEASMQLEYPRIDQSPLLFGIKSLLDRLFPRLADRGQAMSALQLLFALDHEAPVREQIEPAAPTLDISTVLELCRLRLEHLQLPAGVEEITVRIEGQKLQRDQLALFEVKKRRDLKDADRCLARIRAAFGPESVARVVVRAGHLPEARFGFEPLAKAKLPKTPSREVILEPNKDGSQTIPEMPLCRRLLPKPLPLPPRPRHEPESWTYGWPTFDDGKLGPLTELCGPYRISGGWWVREVERDYYYAKTQRGYVLWIYWDRVRRRWFLHGHVD